MFLSLLTPCGTLLFHLTLDDMAALFRIVTGVPLVSDRTCNQWFCLPRSGLVDLGLASTLNSGGLDNPFSFC